MNAIERLHFLHRAWRYRLRTERFGLSFLRRHDLRGRTAVDIGANLGIISYWMHRAVGPAGQVIAFEPQPELVERLADLRRAFGLSRLAVVGCGLSSEAGELILRRPHGHWGGASFQPADAGDARDADFLRVPVTTLDRAFADHPARPVAFIKCDVEGHEAAVFRGGRTLLAEDRPDLLVECLSISDPACELPAVLTEVGYEGFCFAGKGFAPIARAADLRAEMQLRSRTDFVFVPAERAGALPRA